MVRNPNRQLTRIFFLLVLLMAVIGFRYGAANWQPDVDALNAATLNAEGDWIDVVASLGEQALRLFLGMTEGQ